MANDDLDKLGLDEDEVAFIRARRKEKRDNSDRKIRVKTKDGDEAELPFGVAEKWLRKIGVLIDGDDPEPKAEEESEEDEPKDKPVRFAGRRVS